MLNNQLIGKEPSELSVSCWSAGLHFLKSCFVQTIKCFSAITSVIYFLFQVMVEMFKLNLEGNKSTFLMSCWTSDFQPFSLKETVLPPLISFYLYLPHLGVNYCFYGGLPENQN